MKNVKKALQPLEEGLWKLLPWHKKRNKFPIWKCMSNPLNPRMATIAVVVPETFFCGYYISNNEKMACTPRFVFFVRKQFWKHFFANSSANIFTKPGPDLNLVTTMYFVNLYGNKSLFEGFWWLKCELFLLDYFFEFTQEILRNNV